MQYKYNKGLLNDSPQKLYLPIECVKIQAFIFILRNTIPYHLSYKVNNPQ